MMRECPEMNRILSSLGDDLTEEDQVLMQEHLVHCDVCRAQFKRFGWIVKYVAELELEGEIGEHLTDLELASFAWSRFSAEDADRLVQHLARCQECRRALAAIRLALDEYDAEQRRQGMSWETIREELRLALSSPRRALAALGSALAFVSECAVFALALGQVVLAYAIAPMGYGAVPDFTPLALLPEGPVRLWALVAVAVGAGLGLRQLAAVLHALAVKPVSPGAGDQ